MIYMYMYIYTHTHKVIHCNKTYNSKNIRNIPISSYRKADILEYTLIVDHITEKSKFAPIY